MKKTGAHLAVYALEQLGVTHTFGIPGVHNIELYDELDKSKTITPILVTHENAATFMADAVSRTSNKLGVAVIVPAAGLTNGMSGIGEARLDGIAALIISGGVRRDSGRHYQLHQIDQSKMLDGIIKKYFLIERHEDIIPTLFKAYEEARSGEPGPVFVEIPAELQMFQGVVTQLPQYTHKQRPEFKDQPAIDRAVDLILSSKKVGLYLGWGAVHASEESVVLAELLGAPVSTTLQGVSSFSARHSLHTGAGFGPSSVPAAQKAFKDCDALIAVGCRFSELATGSYGFDVPENLIHIDINPDVFNKNYKAKICLTGDSQSILRELIKSLNDKSIQVQHDVEELKLLIKNEKDKYIDTWMNKNSDKKVSPGTFFKSLRSQINDDAMIVVDDGKHTFLTTELLPIYHPRHFISPTDFNCMGYCVPAANATKFVNPDKEVVAIVGDGAFMMTGMELLTASTYGLAIMFFVFHDGELGQISQFQKIPLKTKACTILGDINLEGMALATGTHYVRIESDSDVQTKIAEARKLCGEGRPVLIDVNIDYSQKTMLTKGVLKVNLERFPLSEKIRFIGRAIKRHTIG